MGGGGKSINTKKGKTVERKLKENGLKTVERKLKENGLKTVEKTKKTIKKV